MEILNVITKKLEKFGIQEDNAFLEMSLEEVDQAIKNYCHIDYIPKELLFVRANLVVDYIRYNEANKPSTEGDIDVTAASKVGPLTSISSGGVSYGFANNASNNNFIGNAHVADLDGLLNDYKHQLNEFRRLV